MADWRPKRIAPLSSDGTPGAVEEAADELRRGLFIVTDDSTEEVLIRSFLKHDGLLQKPNVTKAMVSAFASVASAALRGVIVHELTRLEERFPEWRAFGMPEVLGIIERDSVDPSKLVRDQLNEGSGKGLSKGSGKGSENDPSLLTPNSLLLAPDSELPSPSEIADATPRRDVEELLDLLDEEIERNGGKKPKRTKKNDDAIRLMLDRDNIPAGDIAGAIRWCQANEFWRANILSASKLREKYDTLRAQANRKQSPPKTFGQQRQDNTLSLIAELREEEARGQVAGGDAAGVRQIDSGR